MIFRVFVLSLACWRLSALISYETGPFEIFLRFREWIGISHDEGQPVEIHDTGGGRLVFELAELVSCVWCLSLWIGLALVLLFLRDYEWWFLMPFVLSAMAIIFERVMRG